MADILRIAIHEAGHAVVAIALGLPILVAQLGADSRVRIIPLSSGGPQLIQRLVFQVGGWVAERCYFGENNFSGSGHDIHQSILLLHEINAGEPAHVIRQLMHAEEYAATLIERHQLALRRIADALLERGSLTGAEAGALLGWN